MPPERLRLALAVVLLAVLASAWWVRGAGERRVDDACDTWLLHRDSLRTAVSESKEAVGRARDESASELPPHFNNADQTLADLRQWLAVSPGVRRTLDADDDASNLEEGAATAFRFAEDGVAELLRLIEHEGPGWVADWLPAVEASFQNVDDVCLSAARR